MKQLFVITSYGGSYEDAWEHNEFITDDEDKAKAYVVAQEVLRDEVKVTVKKTNEFRDQWLKANPRPVCREPILIDRPKWESKVKVTKEMREERKRIEDLNRAETQAANRPLYQWTQDCYSACNEFEKTFSEEIQKGLHGHYGDCDWRIDPIEWLE